jgi:hypothetical protein
VTLQVQTNAEPDLVYFSQRKDTQLHQYYGKFTYEDSAGAGVTCYIIDDGADVNIQVVEVFRPLTICNR